MIGRALISLVVPLLLGACAAEPLDPRRDHGLLTNLNGVLGGGYPRAVAARQAAFAQERAAHDSLRAAIVEDERTLALTEGEVTRLQDEISALRRETRRLQRFARAVERDSLAEELARDSLAEELARDSLAEELARTGPHDARAPQLSPGQQRQRAALNAALRRDLAERLAPSAGLDALPATPEAMRALHDALSGVGAPETMPSAGR